MSPNTLFVAKGKMQYEYDEYHLDYFMGSLNHGKSDCRIEILLTYTHVYICTWYLENHDKATLLRQLLVPQSYTSLT